MPIPPDVLAAVKRTDRTEPTRQRECLALGAVWDEAAYTMADEALRPLPPEQYSGAWQALMVAAKCERPVALHGVRHGSVTRMLVQGVPVHIVAAWHGHDPAVTLRTDSHADDADLRRAGDALAR